jgi:hypothetical protein
MAVPRGMDKLKTVKITGELVEGDAEEAEEFDKYELERAVCTLQEAAEIKANPKLMKAIGPLLDKKIASVKSLKGLRKLAGEKQKEEAKET